MICGIAFRRMWQKLGKLKSNTPFLAFESMTFYVYPEMRDNESKIKVFEISLYIYNHIILLGNNVMWKNRIWCCLVPEVGTFPMGKLM